MPVKTTRISHKKMIFGHLPRLASHADTLAGEVFARLAERVARANRQKLHFSTPENGNYQRTKSFSYVESV